MGRNPSRRQGLSKITCRLLMVSLSKDEREICGALTWERPCPSGGGKRLGARNVVPFRFRIVRLFLLRPCTGYRRWRSRSPGINTRCEQSVVVHPRKTPFEAVKTSVETLKSAG